MRTRSTPFLIRFVAAAAAFALITGALHGEPLGTAFTYHGDLRESGLPAGGSYDLRFSLYAAETGGSAIGAPTTILAVTVAGGVFTALLDFGSSPFAGEARWLEAAVRKSGGAPDAAYTVLTPRQPITPTPYALYSLQAGHAAAVPWSALTDVPAGFADGIDNDTTYSAGAGLTLSGTAFAVGSLGIVNSMIADNTITAGKISSGEIVKSVNGLKDNVTLAEGANVTIATEGSGTLRISAAALAAGSTGWGLSGNGGTTGANFLGTLDAQALNFNVNNRRALRLEPVGFSDSPNLIGGSSRNLVLSGVRGATIAGGGAIDPSAPRGMETEGNAVTDDFGTIGGGKNNQAGNAAGPTDDAGGATVGGGNRNLASGPFSTVAGGERNAAVSDYGTIAGGSGNVIKRKLGTAGGNYAAIGGGANNQASGDYATIPGGTLNTASGAASFAAGRDAHANHSGSFVWGDGSTTASSTGENHFEVVATGGANFYCGDSRIGLGATAGLDFGARTRQMINLWSVGYGIGVQTSAFYERTDGEFLWYRGGSHSDTFGDPGAGGKTLMRLGNTGTLIVSDSVETPVLKITGGADLAEPFHMSSANIPKGAVVIIDEENAGQLRLSERAYDTRVAGIVSGARGVKPGICLSQQGLNDGGQNVALSGRVYALADAAPGAIKPGDLLTTSDTPGHAMKVTDHAKAPGAILGKAMSSLEKGRGMVLVLVSLQ